MRCLTFTFTGVGSMKWVCDQDVVLAGMNSSAGTALVSENPSLTVATVAASDKVLRADVLAWVNASSTGVGGILPSGLKVPMLAGKEYYVSISTGGFVCLWVEDVS